MYAEAYKVEAYLNVILPFSNNGLFFISPKEIGQVLGTPARVVPLNPRVSVVVVFPPVQTA